MADMSDSVSTLQAPGELSISSTSSASTLVHEQLKVTGDKADAISGHEEDVEVGLETHEVVELQAFLERKEWINEKIRFLESSPPINVFAGMDELHTVQGPVPALASRTQLDNWIVEHDRIEKETEVFDSGDLKKLKSLTKAATQRNLTPEDTDLVELTLTTLFALDRLIHLLRDRSERLDLLGLRLTWEEHRADALSARTAIILDLKEFLQNCARWSTSVYAGVRDEQHDMSPSTALSLQDSTKFSRSGRYQQVDALSRDAAQFASRISSLRHGSVVASGKVLDKLIDDSRSPVPDEMLDEQDRIEDTCAKELETLGRFVMGMVMQWKKADEIYVESQEDRNSARLLIRDLHRALSQPPLRMSDASLRARLGVLDNRHSSRPNPKSAPHTFPRPCHVLFNDQESATLETVDFLSKEMDETRGLVMEASSLSLQYRKRCDAVEAAEALLHDMQDSEARISSTLDRFENGFTSKDSDGSPPDLTHPSCLEPMRFAAFLAMLPSVVEEASQIASLADTTLKQSRFVVVQLKSTGIDEGYRHSFLKEMEVVKHQLKRMEEVKDEITQRVATLREIRRIWTAMDDVSARLDRISAELKDALDKHRWKQHSDLRPLTPESPHQAPQVDSATPEFVDVDISDVKALVRGEIKEPLDRLQELPVSLTAVFNSRLHSISNYLADLQRMGSLLSDVIRQRSVMERLRDESHAIELRIDDTGTQYDDMFTRILSEPLVDEDFKVKEQSILEEFTSLERDLNAFLDTLPTRVPLITRQFAESSSSSSLLADTASSLLARLSFDPAIIDRAVRSDINDMTIRLGGSLKSVCKKRDLCGFYRYARDADVHLKRIRRNLQEMDDKLKCEAVSLDRLKGVPPGDGECVEDVLNGLESMKADLETIARDKDAVVIRDVASLRHTIAQMKLVPGVQEDITLLNVLTIRVSSLDEVDLQHHRLSSKLTTLINGTHSVELAENHRRAAALKPKDITNVLASDVPVKADIAEKQLEDDVFGATGRSSIDRDAVDLLSNIRSLRKRLKSLSLHSLVRPSGSSHGHNSSLPTLEKSDTVSADFDALEEEVVAFPDSTDVSVVAELLSLKEEIRASRTLLSRVKQLAEYSAGVTLCDTTFSEFLDHIDNFNPAPRALSRRPSLVSVSPEEELSERLSHAKGIVGDMSERYAPVADDYRATLEHSRLRQTWEELREMALEKINGHSSRPGSVNAGSSGRLSSASASSSQPTDKKRGKYGLLSFGSRNPSQPGLLAPSASRRSVSNVTSRSQQGKSPSSLNTPKFPAPRSVSGPMSPPTLTSLHNTTFASRQRTTSVSSTASSVMSAGRRGAYGSLSNKRIASMTSERPVRSSMDSPSTSSVRGTWSRAPRQSLGSMGRPSTPSKLSQQTKTKYIANPTNKLDVAVGDVVNNLPVNINVEVVADTWKDKSGKYWIGDGEPKLCFCRILRSQTVMVRVGGGWVELSKFIKGHFADLFRLMPESPPRPGTRQERWINSSTLRKMSEDHVTPEKLPRTPESIVPFVPAFALSTPDDPFPAMLSTSSIGTPLTPLQFIRRADAEPSEFALSATPSRGSMSSRAKGSVPNTPSKNAWRP